MFPLVLPSQCRPWVTLCRTAIPIIMDRSVILFIVFLLARFFTCSMMFWRTRSTITTQSTSQGRTISLRFCCWTIIDTWSSLLPFVTTQLCSSIRSTNIISLTFAVRTILVTAKRSITLLQQLFVSRTRDVSPINGLSILSDKTTRKQSYFSYNREFSQYCNISFRDSPLTNFCEATIPKMNNKDE